MVSTIKFVKKDGCPYCDKVKKVRTTATYNVDEDASMKHSLLDRCREKGIEPLVPMFMVWRDIGDFDLLQTSDVKVARKWLRENGGQEE